MALKICDLTDNQLRILCVMTDALAADNPDRLHRIYQEESHAAFERLRRLVPGKVTYLREVLDAISGSEFEQKLREGQIEPVSGLARKLSRAA